MKSKIISLVLTSVMLFSLLTMAHAITINGLAAGAESSNGDILSATIKTSHDGKVFSRESLRLYGPISIKDSVIINGVENDLYPTFDDIDYALKSLKKEIPEYYNFVSTKINLEDTYGCDYNAFLTKDFKLDSSQANQPEFGNTSLMFDKNGYNDSEYLGEIIERESEVFDIFLDIYENQSKNNQIKEYINSTDNPNPELLAYLLPYNSAFSRQYFSNNKLTAAQYFDKADGRTYATQHATSPNSNYPYYSGHDCTNFASQILIAGGIQMHNAYPNVNSGWWHDRRTVGTVNPILVDTNSLSWSVADNFVRFMGTSGNEYSSFLQFSNKIVWGDFIAFDQNSDGDWNHVGFVTHVGSLGTYSGKYYKNFRVAQHSTNYLKWVSDSGNGWEDLDGSATFAIVRRNAVA